MHTRKHHSIPGAALTFSMGKRVEPSRHMSKKLDRVTRFGFCSPGPAQYVVTTDVHLARPVKTFSIGKRNEDMIGSVKKTDDLGPGKQSEN